MHSGNMLKKKVKILCFVVLGILAALQLIPVERTNPMETSPLRVTPTVEPILKKACYDCHSNKTRWPWYSRVAPVSWWVIDHVNEGREELNFSEWESFSPDKREEKLEELIEEVEEGEMPLPSYVLGHPEAKLTEQEIQILRDWVREM